jgi:hypothetical protein
MTIASSSSSSSFSSSASSSSPSSRPGKVGKLLRWSAASPVLQAPLLLVQVGSLVFRQPYYFRLFSEQELAQIGKGV